MLAETLFGGGAGAGVVKEDGGGNVEAVCGEEVVGGAAVDCDGIVGGSVVGASTRDGAEVAAELVVAAGATGASHPALPAA